MKTAGTADYIIEKPLPYQTWVYHAGKPNQTQWLVKGDCVESAQ